MAVGLRFIGTCPPDIEMKLRQPVLSNYYHSMLLSYMYETTIRWGGVKATPYSIKSVGWRNGVGQGAACIIPILWQRSAGYIQQSYYKRHHQSRTDKKLFMCGYTRVPTSSAPDTKVGGQSSGPEQR
ncbi:hypothetical protein CBL_05884 [Carabus blaptoides fortunei]